MQFGGGGGVVGGSQGPVRDGVTVADGVGPQMGGAVGEDVVPDVSVVVGMRLAEGSGARDSELRGRKGLRIVQLVEC